MLRPLATLVPEGNVSLTWVQWWLADAYEQLGQPDSAAWCLERIEPVAYTPRDGAERPYLRWRLALLDAKLGRLTDAERHLAAAERALDEPNPAVRRRLDDARAALGAQRAMSRSEGAVR